MRGGRFRSASRKMCAQIKRRQVEREGNVRTFACSAVRSVRSVRLVRCPAASGRPRTLVFFDRAALCRNCRSSAPCRVGYPLMSVYTKKHDLPTYPEPPGNPIYLVRKPLLTVTPTLPRPYLPIASAKRASTDTPLPGKEPRTSADRLARLRASRTKKLLRRGQARQTHISKPCLASAHGAA